MPPWTRTTRPVPVRPVLPSPRFTTRRVGSFVSSCLSRPPLAPAPPTPTASFLDELLPLAAAAVVSAAGLRRAALRRVFGAFKRSG